MLHVGGISAKGLSTLLGKLSAHDIDLSGVSRQVIHNANYTEFLRHRVEEPLILHDGSTFTWEYICPATWLATIIDRVPDVQYIFDVAMKRHPASRQNPWHMVVAFDEFAPGNKLQFDNRISQALPNGCRVGRDNFDPRGNSVCGMQYIVRVTFQTLACYCTSVLQPSSVPREAKVHGGIVHLLGIRPKRYQHRPRMAYVCCFAELCDQFGPGRLVALPPKVPREATPGCVRLVHCRLPHHSWGCRGHAVRQAVKLAIRRRRPSPSVGLAWRIRYETVFLTLQR